MIVVKKTETKDELLGIMSLQAKNFKSNLSSDEIMQEGFVTLKHDIETLQLMNTHEPQIIALDGDVVIGYALVLVKELRSSFPILGPMFDMFNEISFETKKISDSKYYVMGQVCIDKKYRGKGIFAKLYNKHKEVFSTDYDYCITEVSSSNIRSLKAHQKVGFESIHTFSDSTDSWNILLLNLNKEATRL